MEQLNPAAEAMKPFAQVLSLVISNLLFALVVQVPGIFCVRKARRLRNVIWSKERFVLSPLNALMASLISVSGLWGIYEMFASEEHFFLFGIFGLVASFVGGHLAYYYTLTFVEIDGHFLAIKDERQDRRVALSDIVGLKVTINNIEVILNDGTSLKISLQLGHSGRLLAILMRVIDLRVGGMHTVMSPSVKPL